jgi:group I intron endonuclease
MTCGVYNIQNITNGHCYVGSSVNIEGRIRQHSKGLETGTHPSAYFQRAYDKYGEDNFEYDILKVCGRDELLLHEQHYMDLLDSRYNVSHIAGKIEVTEEIRRGRRERFLGNQYAKGNQNAKGKKLSEERRRQISDILKGHKSSESQKECLNIGRIIRTMRYVPAWNKGKHLSEMHRHNLSISKIGKKLSEETKKNMSEAQKKRYANQR